MAANKKCYACYCKYKKDVPMVFDKDLGKYGAYVCTECTHVVYVHNPNADDSKDEFGEYR